jgi:hypothetical protein
MTEDIQGGGNAAGASGWAVLMGAIVVQVISVGGLAMVTGSAVAPATPHALHAWAVLAFLVDIAWIAGVLMAFGYAVNGDIFGVAISSYNDYSLSKVQMALWTIVVLAALLTTAKLNLLSYFGPMPPAKDLVNGVMVASGPLEIAIPGELLAAMGIAAFSTAAVPSILALKAGQGSSDDEVAAAQQNQAKTTGGDPNTVAVTGRAVGHTDPKHAGWLDIVTGDEAANAGKVDLSKVQQLLVTLLLLGTYVAMVVRVFGTATTGLNSLPALGEQFITLLAISHAGYLGYKAVPKSGSGSASSAPAAPAAPVAQPWKPSPPSPTGSPR